MTSNACRKLSELLVFDDYHQQFRLKKQRRASQASSKPRTDSRFTSHTNKREENLSRRAAILQKHQLEEAQKSRLLPASEKDRTQSRQGLAKSYVLSS